MAASLEDLDRRVSALEPAHNDSTESLKWMLTKLARTQAVQDEHTLRLERIETKVEELDRKVETIPRVLAETVQESEQRVRGEIAQNEVRLRGEIAQTEARIREGLAALLEASEQRLAAAADARSTEIEQRVISAIQSALQR